MSAYTSGAPSAGATVTVAVDTSWPAAVLVADDASAPPGAVQLDVCDAADAASLIVSNGPRLTIHSYVQVRETVVTTACADAKERPILLAASSPAAFTQRAGRRFGHVSEGGSQSEQEPRDHRREEREDGEPRPGWCSAEDR